MINQLILGDNLEIMKTMQDGSIDLIYLDPPFFSNRNYEIIWGDKGETRSFEDRWSGGIEHYIGWLKERVQRMYDLLSPTGSLYLHCDYHANAYIRVYILDKIFSEKNFRNEIAWHYIMGASARSSFGEKFDLIYWYSKSKDYIFNLDDIKIPYNPETIARSKRGEARYKKVLTDMDGKNPGNVWCDIHPIQGNGSERIGYPTQKPEALLERIIKASSSEGDVVLDPFVGGGTTVAVANRLNRKWIGIDQSVQAIKVSEMRIRQQGSKKEAVPERVAGHEHIITYKKEPVQRELFFNPFEVRLHKYDYDMLRHKEPFDFESWIIQKFKGKGNEQQRHDMGIDGDLNKSLIQVKRSDDIGRNPIDNFKAACERKDRQQFLKNIQDGNPVGYFIAFSFGKGAIQEVARLKNEENVIIVLVRVDQIVPIAYKPLLTVTLKDLGVDSNGLRQIEFIATARTDGTIEMYSWSWDYNKDNPSFDILRDIKGIQQYKFKSGEHTIGVKAVDNDGIEAIETIQLFVNGEIKTIYTEQ